MTTSSDDNLRRTPRTVFAAFAAIMVLDILFVVLHLLIGEKFDIINLDQEGNLTAWYSSTKLLALAAMCFTIWSTERIAQAGKKWRLTVLWLLVAAVFLGLSMDETASIHERLARFVMQESYVGLDIRESVLDGDSTKDSFAWVLILSPIILSVTVFFFIFFYSRLFLSRTGYVPALIALSMFLIAVGMEATVYFTPSMSDWDADMLNKYKLGIALEETAEMMGSTLFLLAFWRYWRFLKESH